MYAYTSVFPMFLQCSFIHLWVLIILKILWVVALIWYDISLSAVGGVRHTITSTWCTLGNILCIKNVYNSWHMNLKGEGEGEGGGAR
jgi:hypothetical protein